MKKRSSFFKVSAGMLIFALSVPVLFTGCRAPHYNSGAIYDSAKTAENAAPYVSYEPNVNYNTEEYNAIKESSFHAVATSPLSTFAADVDTASYANIRRFINSGELPPADSVRIEEMLNYFRYDYPQPKDGEPFSVSTEISACPWNPDTKLMMIGMQAKKVEESEKKPSNLVFLIDVSGSMDEPDKLPLVKNAFLLLCEELKENDTISIVTYAGYDQVVLEGARGSDSKEIMSAIEDLEAGGSTAGSDGIKTAYKIAKKYFKSDGNNRVILATDGDLNVGITSEGELTRLIKKEKESGVFLSVLGFGTENIKDNKMEALADNGNGNYSYIDSRFEAKKVLSEELGANFFTVAKDVKFQLEFNPKFIKGYRLIGYENRIMDDEDFKDDTKDGGEVGSGHRVTVLYEIVDTDSPMDIGSDLKYQSSAVTESNDLLNIAVRYKEPDSETSQELNYPVTTESIKPEMSDNMKFASAIAETGMLLRDSEYKGNSSYESALSLLNSVSDIKDDTSKLEFLLLVDKISDLEKMANK